MAQRTFDGLLWSLAWVLSAVDVCLAPLLCPFEWAGALWRRARRRCRGQPGRPKVIVVGGSFSGLTAARELSAAEYDVTLVDFKDYFEYTPGILRAAVEPAHLAHLVRPLPKALARLGHRFVHGEVTQVAPDAVTVRLCGGAETVRLPFDFCLLGCGTPYPLFKPSAAEATVAQRRALWEATAAKLAAARSCLVVGGGPVGAELAAEVLTRYPSKRVTIVDRSAELCKGFPARSRRYIREWFQRRAPHAVLELGASIARGATGELLLDERGCTLSDGRRLDADVVFRCLGHPPAAGGVLAAHFPHALAGGAVRVNDHLQVDPQRAPGLFAMGDVMLHTGSRELKLGHTAEVNAYLVAENVKHLHRGHGLLAYPHGFTGCDVTPTIYDISLGKYDGTMGFNWLILNGAVPAVLKWVLEWTKVALVEQRRVGHVFWWVADHMSFLLARTVLRKPKGEMHNGTSGWAANASAAAPAALKVGIAKSA